MSKEIEISTKDADGGQVIPVWVAGAVELDLMLAGADAFVDRNGNSTTRAHGDIAPRGARKAGQT